LSSPVDGSVFGTNGVFSDLISSRFNCVVLKDSSEFFLGPVGHVVVANSVGITLLVVLLDEGVLEGELAEAHLVLLHGGV